MLALNLPLISTVFRVLLLHWEASVLLIETKQKYIGIRNSVSHVPVLLVVRRVSLFACSHVCFKFWLSKALLGANVIAPLIRKYASVLVLFSFFL